jgi:hypothetical protein
MKELELLEKMSKDLIAEVICKLNEDSSRKHYSAFYSSEDFKKVLERDREVIISKKDNYRCFLSIDSNKRNYIFHIYELGHDDLQLHEFTYEELILLVNSLIGGI